MFDFFFFNLKKYPIQNKKSVKSAGYLTVRQSLVSSGSKAPKLSAC